MDYYDSIAPSYNELHGREQYEKLTEIKKHCKIKNTDVILDVGGGTGLSSHVFPNTIINLDSSQELLRQSRAKNIRGSMEKIPLKNHSVDWVLCITAIHHAKDIDQTCREFLRVGKEHFVITILKKSPRRKELTKALKRYFDLTSVLKNHHDDILVLQRRISSQCN